MNINLILVILFITIVYLFGMRWIIKRGMILHEQLSSLKTKVQLSNSNEELQLYWNELKELYKKCFHNTQYMKVMEIKTIIQNKKREN